MFAEMTIRGVQNLIFATRFFDRLGPRLHQPHDFSAPAADRLHLDRRPFAAVLHFDSAQALRAFQNIASTHGKMSLKKDCARRR
jgi:hypothetical protein